MCFKLRFLFWFITGTKNSNKTIYDHPVRVPDYNWPPLDLTAVSVSSSKRKSSINDNMVHDLGFYRGLPMTRFAIWKPYSHCQSFEEIHIWPISISDLQWHLRRSEPWPQKKKKKRIVFFSVIKSTPHYLEIRVFLTNLKTPAQPSCYSSLSIKCTQQGKVWGALKIYSHIACYIENLLFKRTCFPGRLRMRQEVRLIEVPTIGGLLECCMLIA